ncbi:unannotated protein [freshwater metagenome]|uniref:Unannotated protein n=1 Tax=freshwater metagenome TaxID=449393 RepID=A0A6J6Z304_9ZZZZ
MIEAPLMAVVPEVAFCTNCAAFTAALKVVVPVLVREILPRPWEPPTIPVKVMSPEPVVIVRPLVSPDCELTVPAKLT